MNKDEYIKRSDALELTVYQSMMGINMAQTKLREMPGEDVRPVVHGHWIHPSINNEINNKAIFSDCSVCGYSVAVIDARNYCPNCGAIMDEKEEEE